MTEPDPLLVSHYSADGPVAACWTFIESLLGPEPSFDQAWGLLDHNLRLCRAQAWLWNNHDYPPIGEHLDVLAQWMADGPNQAQPPTKLANRLWSEFADIELGAIREAWLPGYERQLGASSRTRVVGVDLELVLLIPTDGVVRRFDQMTLVDDALPFLMRRVSGRWYVAAWGDRLPIPGWPPDLNPDPSGDIG